MRCAALLLVLAGCGGGPPRRGPEAGPDAIDAALEAFQRGDHAGADRILAGSQDVQAVLVRARLESLRNRDREALAILRPLAPRRGEKPRDFDEMQLQGRVLSDIASACVRMDDFAGAADAFAQLGERVLALKYGRLAKDIGYLGGLGESEAHAPFLSMDPLPTVRMSVNGTPGTFIVDTGLDEIVLDREFARFARVSGIGLRTDALRRSLDEAVIDEVGLGPLRVRNVPAHVGEHRVLLGRGEERPAAAVADIQGAVGLAFLMHFDFTLDFRRGRLTLRRAGGKIPGVPVLYAGDRNLLLFGKANGTLETWVAVHTGLAGVTVAVSIAFQRLQPDPLTELTAGPLRLVKPALDLESFPPGLESSFGIPVGFALGPAALRGRSLRVEPRSMTALLE